MVGGIGEAEIAGQEDRRPRHLAPRQRIKADDQEVGRQHGHQRPEEATHVAFQQSLFLEPRQTVADHHHHDGRTARDRPQRRVVDDDKRDGQRPDQDVEPDRPLLLPAFGLSRGQVGDRQPFPVFRQAAKPTLQRRVELHVAQRVSAEPREAVAVLDRVRVEGHREGLPDPGSSSAASRRQRPSTDR